MCQIRGVEMCSLGGGKASIWGVEMCQIWGVEMCRDEVIHNRDHNPGEKLHQLEVNLLAKLSHFVNIQASDC